MNPYVLVIWRGSLTPLTPIDHSHFTTTCLVTWTFCVARLAAGETHLKEDPDFVRSEATTSKRQPPAPTLWERLLLVLLLVSSSITLAAVLPDLSVVFGLTGGFCGGLVTFCFPAIFYIRVASKKGERALTVKDLRLPLLLVVVHVQLQCESSRLVGLGWRNPTGIGQGKIWEFSSTERTRSASRMRWNQAEFQGHICWSLSMKLNPNNHITN